MKCLFLTLALFAFSYAHATDSQLSCTLSSEGNILEEKVLNVTLSHDEISFEANFFGKIQKVNGKFIRNAKNGSLMYDGSDLMEQIDQSDLGYIFVAPTLLKNGRGKIGLSVRQLGDSEGSNWINDSYDCKQK